MDDEHGKGRGMVLGYALEAEVARRRPETRPEIIVITQQRRGLLL